MSATSHHLYVHVPFCRLVCGYCDFVTVAGRVSDIPRYVDALLGEMAARPAPGSLETIYFGGGTPSRLPTADVARLVRAAVARWGREPSEVTLEANPSAREAPDWHALRRSGVTRISLGVQSFRDAELRRLARGHSSEEARDAVAAAQAAGFESISVDLMYGIPGQTLADWRAGLEAAIAVEPDHLSLYALSLALQPDEWSAPPRAGALRWRARAAARQDDDLAAAQYELAQDELGAAGFEHYELSSWARPGHESRHNRAYWDRRPYTGLGSGAHSFDGAVRSWNARSLDAYLHTLGEGRLPVEGSERIDVAGAKFESVALGLRHVRGLSRRSFRDQFGVDLVTHYASAVDGGSRSGLLEVEADAVRLSRRGRLLANEVLAAFVS